MLYPLSYGGGTEETLAHDAIGIGSGVLPLGPLLRQRRPAALGEQPAQVVALRGL